MNATESSLITKYPADHKVFTDTQSYWDQGYGVVKELYMDNQDVTWQKQNAVRVLAHARQVWMHARFELEESGRDQRCRGMAG